MSSDKAKITLSELEQYLVGAANILRGPVELNKATCDRCKVETEVPFKPDGSKPVYCRECFQQQKPRRY